MNLTGKLVYGDGSYHLFVEFPNYVLATTFSKTGIQCSEKRFSKVLATTLRNTKYLKWYPEMKNLEELLE